MNSLIKTARLCGAFAVSAVFLWAVTWLGVYGVGASARAKAPESRVGFFGEPITGVANEFMRRSPALAATFQQFKDCWEEYGEGCDPTPILAQRDETIAREWPRILDYLLVSVDWDYPEREFFSPTGTDSATIDRRIFFEDLEKIGEERLRYECVPVIVFYDWPQEDRTVYNFEEFSCRE